MPNACFGFAQTRDWQELLARAVRGVTTRERRGDTTLGAENARPQPGRCMIRPSFPMRPGRSPELNADARELRIVSNTP